MAPNVPDQAELDSHHDELRSLWLEQGWSVKRIRSFMVERHGFNRSEQQYMRYFNKWGFKKNFTTSDWNFIAYRQEKRKRDGKDPGEVWQNGKLVPERKVRKEISRHVTLSSQYTAAQTSEPQTPEGIMVCTPQPSMETEVTNSLDSNPPSLYPTSDLDMMGCEISNDLLHIDLNPPQVQYDPSQVEFPNLFLQDSGAFIADPYLRDFNLDHTLLIPDFAISASSQELVARILECSDPMGSEILHETRSILMESNAFDKDNSRSFISALEPITIDDGNGSFKAKAEFMFHSPDSDKLSLFLQLCIFLSSNNLLPQQSTENLVRLITRNRAHSTLELVISSKSTEIEIFMSNLLAGAAAVGDVQTCRILIEAGADIDASSGPTLLTPLQYALREDNVECAKMLLEATANPNFTAVDGERPLHIACLNCKGSDSVKLLLQYKAHVNLPTIRDTPLQIATRRGRHDLVRILLDENADPNLTSSSNATALQIACCIGGDAAIVDTLVAAGANIDMRPGYDAQNKSNSEHDDEEIDLEFGELAHGIPNHLKPAILIAADQENWEAVQLLLEEGATIDIDWTKCSPTLLDKEMSRAFDEEVLPVFSPLHAAVRSGNITMARMLLSAGANFDARPGGIYGYTALQICAAKGNQRLIEILLRKGADIDACAGDYLGETAVQAAACHSDISVLSFLIEEGADPNGLPGKREGFTALQKAVMAANVEAVQLLLDANATVNTDPALTGGATTIDLAFDIEEDVSRIEILRLLRQAGAHTRKPKSLDLSSGLLHSAVRRRDVESVENLLKRGENPNLGYCSIAKRTPLQQASYNGDQVLVRLLTDYGAHVNAAPWQVDGYTALQAASLGGHMPVANFLLELGAQINSAGSYEGYSAVECAVKSCNLDLVQLFLNLMPDAISSDTICRDRIVGLFLCAKNSGVAHNATTLKLLIDAGANVNGTLKVGTLEIPFLQQAVRCSNRDIVQCLILGGADLNGRYKSDQGGAATALQEAAVIKNAVVAQLLLEWGADVNSPADSEGGYTALQAAVINQDWTMVRLLISFDVDVNGAPSPKGGRTALQWAVTKGSLPLTRFLISNGADLNGPPAPFRGCTAMQAAALHGNIRIVQMLLSAGVPVNEAPAAEDGRGATEAAAENGRLDTLHMLLNFYPDTEDFDIVKMRAARLARANGRVAIERFLLAYRKVTRKK
ncbi:ankyrin repeat-containing domain protein [Penicillium verhagenii]|uniref:ankyrin repeat-containing domain protein n=1 Tax=Penicillium verhagenii TaxID=1562060 RepID=UPI0025453FBD|nr:ankyrin repeat-containing domain protein [Penicillium verhagenii]KAJ5927957.1 ankyrin repeat-containing domain protein [Penicillium verhagenii]